jgi:hypothetical protein
VNDAQILIQDENGQVVEVVGSWSDITERKQLGEALAAAQEKNLNDLREAQSRLIDAIETISEGFSLYDAEDKLVLSNSRYRELFASHADVIVPARALKQFCEQPSNAVRSRTPRDDATPGLRNESRATTLSAKHMSNTAVTAAGSRSMNEKPLAAVL